MIRYVDAHCHLDLLADYEQAVLNALAMETAILTMTTTPRAWTRNVLMSERFENVTPALGYHPQLAGILGNELPQFDLHLGEARFIGEVGLDASAKHYYSFKTQERIFNHILKRCALAGRKVLSVHSVRSATTVLDMVEHSGVTRKDCVIILHWFTGTIAEARRALAMGCYFSINPAMMDRPNHRALLLKIPANRMLTESDEPFSSAGNEGMKGMVKTLAELRGEAEESIRQSIVENYNRLF